MLKKLILSFCVLTGLQAIAAQNKPSLAMLTYNAPTEHNVLQSLLCLEPCQGEDCQQYEGLGEVLSNSDIVAIKPKDLSESDNTVRVLEKIKPDMLSLSGHHSAGFSGSEGSFYFDQLSTSIQPQQLVSAFSSPKVVLLNGCYTDASSDFNKDPIGYIEHIVTETSVREASVSRFRSALSQISGFQKGYVNVFPQACIMGYEGLSIPGGIPQIYMQFTNYLRALSEVVLDEKLKPKFKILSGDYKKVEEEIRNECPGGQWPCNLCEVDSGYYSKLSKTMATYLKKEKQRVAQKRSHQEFWGTGFEQKLKNNRFYKNTGWVCQQTAEVREPIIPRTINRTKNAKLLFRALFWIQDSSLSAEDKSSLAAESLHGLTYINYSNEETLEIKRFIKTNEYALSKISDLNLSEEAFVNYFKIANKLECEDCVEFTNSQASFKSLSKIKKLAFVKTLNENSPLKHFELIFSLDDKALINLAALNLAPANHTDLYKNIFNEYEDLAVAAAKSFAGKSNIPDQVLLWAIASPFQEARIVTSFYIGPSSSQKVFDATLNSSHSEDFNQSWSQYLNQDLLY